MKFIETHCSIPSAIKYALISCCLLAIVASGCKTETLPDPNDPVVGGLVTGEILLRNVNAVVSSLDQRMTKGEIDKSERDKLLEKEVHQMLDGINVDKIPPKQAWQFGDAFRLAGDWDQAQKLYTIAVKSASSVDRRVNDSLRLARVQAHFGNVDAAIATCRTLFDVSPQDKAPILMAVLYEIVPEGQGKGKDPELAKLLEDAIAQHEETIINATSEAGKAFLIARPLHVHNAWFKAAQLYGGAGKLDDARRAIEMDEKSRGKRASF